MVGLFSMFGRGRELERMDHALRVAGLHPRLVPDAVKLALLKLMKGGKAGASPDETECLEAARLLAYCMLGKADFVEVNDAAAAPAVEARIDAAIDNGDSLDARIVLLALHADLVQPEIVERYGLTSD